MSLRTAIIVAAAIGSLTGCVTAAEPEESVDPTSAEACKALCADFKADECYDAARYDACLRDCDVAVADQIQAWTNCNQPTCDPECVLVPGDEPGYLKGCEERCGEWEDQCGPSGPLTIVVCEGACNIELFAGCLADLSDLCNVRDSCFDSPGLPSLPGLP